jgi:hypothetical protein
MELGNSHFALVHGHVCTSECLFEEGVSLCGVEPKFLERISEIETNPAVLFARQKEEGNEKHHVLRGAKALLTSPQIHRDCIPKSDGLIRVVTDAEWRRYLLSRDGRVGNDSENSVLHVALKLQGQFWERLSGLKTKADGLCLLLENDDAARQLPPEEKMVVRFDPDLRVLDWPLRDHFRKEELPRPFVDGLVQSGIIHIVG